MTRQMLTPPDPVQLRDALRGLRFFLRRGGETIADTLNLEALPKPASNLAGAVLREVDGLARSVDGLASGLAKTLLGGQPPQVAQLDDLIAQPRSDALFAAAFYVALRSVLRRLGATSVFVSEAAARSAVETVALPDPTEPAAGYAAALTLALLEARVIRGTTAQQAALVPGAALEPVSIFAVMLWIQSERSEAENETALNAATDLAVALAPEVSAAFAARDGARITALFTRYVPHV